jgi:hypothetical protein
MNRGDISIKVISAFIAAVASAGFVAAVGGGILWARFRGAHLPADQAVAAVSNHELIVVGGTTLVGFLLAGLAALVGVYVLDSTGSPTPRTRRGLIVLMVVEIAVAIVFIESDFLTQLLLAAAFVTAGVLVAFLLDDLARALPPAPSPPQVRAEPPRWLERSFRWSRDRLFSGVDRREDARRVLAGVVLVLGVVLVGAVRDWIWIALWIAVAILLVDPWKALFPGQAPLRRVVVLSLIAYGATALIRFDEPLAKVAAAAVLLALLNLAVARATGRSFALYGVSVFLSVVLFGGVLSYVRTVETPKLQGVAVVMKNGASACGLYVAETDSRLYLARVDTVRLGKRDHIVNGSGRLLWLPRDQIENSELGPLRVIPRAQANAAELRSELIADRQASPAAKTAKAPAIVPGLPTADNCLPQPQSVPPRQTEQRVLAEKFQPRLVVDRADGFWPISALTIFKLRHGDKVTCRQASVDCIDTTRPSGLPWLGEPNEWLNYPGPNRDLGKQRADMLAALRFNGDPAKSAREYFFVTGGGVGQPTSVQYWFYYHFNYQRYGLGGFHLGKAGYHEGDFESIGVLLSRHSKQPRYVWMARHDKEGRPFLWNEPKLVRSGDHLGVFAARGSHASYESCGTQHRPVGRGTINDETACGSSGLVFEPGDTPLTDLSFAPWACWQGHFGYARASRAIPASQLVFADGPRSPLWQQFGSEPCASAPVSAVRPDLGEEVLDEPTATALRANGGRLEPRFDSCADWQKPPTRGVYVVACSDKLLKAFFHSGLERMDSVEVQLERPGQPTPPLGVPAIYRSPDAENLDGIALGAKKAITESVYAVCFSGGKAIDATFPSVSLVPGRKLMLHTGAKRWFLGAGNSATPSRGGHCQPK